MSDFSIFKRFPTMAEAQQLIELLEANNIKFSLIDNSHDVDITFTGNQSQSEIQLLLQQSDFDKVETLMENAVSQELSEEDRSHYLFEFTDDELYEILTKKDEWSVYDYVLAQKILAERGKAVSEDELEAIKAKREAELAEPEEGPQIQIFAGYFFGILGGLIGLMIGWYLWKAKKTLPNGDKVPTYTEDQRNHGKTITIISVIAMVGAVCAKFMGFFG